MVGIDIDKAMEEHRNRKKKTFVKGVGLVEEEDNLTLTIKQIDFRLKAIINLTPLEQEEEIDNIVEESGRKIASIKKQFIIIKKRKLEDKRKLNKILLDDDVEKDNVSLREKVLSLMQRKEFGQASELLVDEIAKNNYIYTTKVDKASEVYIYKEGIYIPEGEFEIKEQLRIILKENYSEWTASQVMAKIKMDTGISSEEFFKEDNFYEVPVMNGILNLKTKVLEEFSHLKIFFSKLPVTYNPEIKCPLIDKFLSDVLSKPEDKLVFYELAGFGLVKDYFLEKACMFIGNGRNGKGKSIELLKRLVGVGNTASVPLSAITSDSPFVERLWKRYFNLAGDISSKDLKETGMFKQLTGRDPISANRKYKNIVEFTNYAKMVFACNELPRVYDYSDGFWERWVLLEFPYKFVDEVFYDTEKNKHNLKIRDINIISKITSDEEMSGFLNAALDGLHRCFKNKKFSYTIGTEEVKNKWIRMSDSFMAFCMDCVDGDYDSKVTKRELRNIYKKYCDKHKIGGVGDKAIKATLQEMFGATEDRATMGGTDASQQFVWTGIKLKNGDDLLI
jgi:putative DNA primase/helicase